MTNSTFSDSMPGLAADGPHPDLGAAADLFAPLIGDWRMRTTYLPLEGPRRDLEGFWSFRWGLGGRAVYDVIGFRAPDAPPEMPHTTGLTVRFYDLALRTWRQVWIIPFRTSDRTPSGTVVEFTVRGDGGRILIEGGPSTTERYRWSFESIAENAFAWEGRTSYDGGATWHLVQTIDGER